MKTMNKSLVLAALAAAIPAADALADYASMCKEAMKRKREVIWQVWDRTPYTWPKGESFNPAKSAVRNLAELAKSQVMIDTVSFIPLGNFANLSANVPSSEPPLKRQPEGSWQLKGYRNVMEDFVKAKTDPLKEACTWARKEKKEIFVALPVNAKVHATAYNLKTPPPPWIWNNYLIGPWKLKNKSFLMGGPESLAAKASKTKQEMPTPPIGSWLSG